jgi:tetratricopeptide (TPR) repeat protein
MFFEILSFFGGVMLNMFFGILSFTWAISQKVLIFAVSLVLEITGLSLPSWETTMPRFFDSSAPMAVEMTATDYYQRGQEYYDAQNYTAALADFNAVLKMSPQHKQAMILRGMTFAAIGDYKHAITDYSAVLKTGRYAVAYNNRGNVYAFMGDARKALADYNRAIQIDRHYTDAFYNRAILYRAQGNYKQCLADYTTVLKIDPVHTGALNNRGTVYADQGQYQSALADFDAVLRLEPVNSTVYATAAGNRQAVLDIMNVL